jgi:hypothetical protein
MRRVSFLRNVYSKPKIVISVHTKGDPGYENYQETVKNYEIVKYGKEKITERTIENYWSNMTNEERNFYCSNGNKSE